MFSSDQLSKLTQLKQDIRSSKDMAEGVVRATSGRFGFVTLDDGRDAFLNPEQMERVFPGDRVEIEVVKNKKDQYEAKLERLLSSSITVLSGRYRVRGKGHFIATDSANFSRWIFIPPKSRAQCNEGDYATAKIIQHPFKDGRAQAKITTKIGNDNTSYIEKHYAVGKHQLDANFTSKVLQEANNICAKSIGIEDAKANKRQDLRDTPFVTIDSAGTRDMDDALAIETNDNGWILSVAIANPSADIKFDSLLDKTARKRAQTTYFADKPLTMLPEELSVERYSLKSGEDRLSLVFQCEIDKSGHISAFTFIPAIIKSHAKLSYAHVAALLEGRDYKTSAPLSDPKDFNEALSELLACTTTLKNYRLQNHVVIDNRPDFALYLNEKGKLQSIEKIERTCAHSIVEEAMLITNRCAGDFLASHKAGLYIQHRGYREERRKDIETLLSEKTNSDISDTNQLESYVSTIKMLQSKEEYKPLLFVQQHFLEASKISHEPSSHFGLGFKHYATITSPIRRYQDLYNQRTILQLLAGEKPPMLDSDQIAQLQSSVKASREAANFMSQWLICDYMQNKMGETFSATISLLTNQGVGIRLGESGVEGFIPALKDKKGSSEKIGDKISFNNQRMELSWNDQAIALGQEVSVVLKKVDHEKKKLEFNFS